MVCFFCFVFGLHYLWIRQAAPQQYKINKLYGLFILYCLRFALSLDKTGCTSTIQNKPNKLIRLKQLSIRTDHTGYSFFITIDVPFGEQLTEISNNLKKSVTQYIESDCGILLEDISIIVDKILIEKETDRTKSA